MFDHAVMAFADQSAKDVLAGSSGIVFHMG
jgi:hypothetical protein